jgi:hypothetical protein
MNEWKGIIPESAMIGPLEYDGVMLPILNVMFNVFYMSY